MLYLVENYKVKNGNIEIGDVALDFVETAPEVLFNKKLIINTEVTLNCQQITESERISLIEESDIQKANDVSDSQRLSMIEAALDELILGGA